ncbi:hypothetical protein ACLOJK_018810 [Asimina triloba]
MGSLVLMPRSFVAPSSPWLLRDLLRDLPHLFIEQALAATEVVVPDSDEGLGDNCSMGQHVPTGGVDDRRVIVSEGPFERDRYEGSSSIPVPQLDINVKFIEPFRELVSSYSVQLQKHCIRRCRISQTCFFLSSGWVHQGPG